MAGNEPQSDSIWLTAVGSCGPDVLILERIVDVAADLNCLPDVILWIAKHVPANGSLVSADAGA
jgi:hypothetical protein